jgi:hypothetical protein
MSRRVLTGSKGQSSSLSNSSVKWQSPETLNNHIYRLRLPPTKTQIVTGIHISITGFYLE